MLIKKICIKLFWIERNAHIYTYIYIVNKKKYILIYRAIISIIYNFKIFMILL